MTVSCSKCLWKVIQTTTLKKAHLNTGTHTLATHYIIIQILLLPRNQITSPDSVTIMQLYHGSSLLSAKEEWKVQRERQEDFASGRAEAIKSLSDTVFMPSSEPGCQQDAAQPRPPWWAATVISARHCAGLHWYFKFKTAPLREAWILSLYAGDLIPAQAKAELQDLTGKSYLSVHQVFTSPFHVANAVGHQAWTGHAKVHHHTLIRETHMLIEEDGW